MSSADHPSHASRFDEDCTECIDGWARAELEHVEGLTRDFSSRTEEALRAATLARTAIAQLISNKVYDVELAEGAEGGDAIRELDAATAALRNVKRIAKVRRDLLQKCRQDNNISREASR